MHYLCYFRTVRRSTTGLQGNKLGSFWTYLGQHSTRKEMKMGFDKTLVAGVGLEPTTSGL